MNQTIEFTDQGLALFKDFEKEAFIVGGYYGGLPTVALKVITSWAYVTSRLLSFSGKLWADGDMLMGTNDFITFGVVRSHSDIPPEYADVRNAMQPVEFSIHS